VPRPEGVIDEEDDWEEMAQLEGLGQGGRAYICVSSSLWSVAFAGLKKEGLGEGG
jgi:hypothetical protein